MSQLYKQIYEIVKNIPEGKVSTYSQVALLTGNQRRSRVVGFAMAACNDNTVPCHRVIYSDGNLSKTFGIMGNSLQKSLLESEGVEFSQNNTVDLSVYLWDIDTKQDKS